MNPISLVYKVTGHLLDMATDRPLSLMATGLGLRDIFVGLGFLFNFNDISTTLLYQNFNGLLPGSADGYLAGSLFLVLGLIVFVTAFMGKIHIASIGLRGQALVWLFSTIMYVINGQLLLAVIIGLFFCVAAGYLSFYFKYAPVLRHERQRIGDVIRQHHQEDEPPRRRV